jgi:hypothetical protein
MVIAARMRRSERRMIRALTDAGATTPARAVPVDTAGPIERFTSGRLERAGVLVPGGKDRYYFNHSAYGAFRRRRRRRALVTIIMLLIGLGVLYLRGDIA